MKKITEVTESIKSKLSFDDYETSEHTDIKTEEHIDIKKVKKVKRTFYIPEEISQRFDDFYAKKLGQRVKIDKGDIVSQAIINFLEDEDAEVKSF